MALRSLHVQRIQSSGLASHFIIHHFLIDMCYSIIVLVCLRWAVHFAANISFAYDPSQLHLATKLRSKPDQRHLTPEPKPDYNWKQEDDVSAVVPHQSREASLPLAIAVDAPCDCSFCTRLVLCLGFGVHPR